MQTKFRREVGDGGGFQIAVLLCCNPLAQKLIRIGSGSLLRRLRTRSVQTKRKGQNKNGSHTSRIEQQDTPDCRYCCSTGVNPRIFTFDPNRL